MDVWRLEHAWGTRQRKGIGRSKKQKGRKWHDDGAQVYWRWVDGNGRDTATTGKITKRTKLSLFGSQAGGERWRGEVGEEELNRDCRGARVSTRARRCNGFEFEAEIGNMWSRLR